MSSLSNTYLWIFLLAVSTLHNEKITNSSSLHGSDLTTSTAGTDASTNTTSDPEFYSCSEQCLPAPDPTPAPPCPDTVRTDNDSHVSNSSALNCNGTIENCSISSNVTSCNGSLDNDCTYNRSVSSLCPNRTEEMADNTTCSTRTGECFYGCVEGYAKPFCDQLCPQNCTSCTYDQDINRMVCEFCTGNNYLVDGRCTPCSSKCVVTYPSSCFMLNGTCRLGCPTLQYGPTCDERCRGLCATDICDQFTGECPYGCKRSEYCNPFCTNLGHLGCVRGVCNTDCSCKEGCKVNFYGSGCSVPCPNNCVSNPNNEETKCNSTDGACLFGCDKNKSWGNKCDKPCPSNCVAGECLSEDGNCSQGCDGNWYGARCLFPCNPNCVNVSCLESDGTCIEGCKPGWHGAQCDRECNTNCFGGICDQDTSECFDGCKVGFYGSACEKNCRKACVRNVCDFDFGNCTYGCNEGFEGQDCGTQLPLVVSPNEDHLYVNIGIGFGSGLIVIITLVIVCWKLKCRRQEVFRKTRTGLNGMTKIFNEFLSDYTELDLSRFDFDNAYGMLELTDNTNTRIAASNILCAVIAMSPDRIRQEFSRLSNEITRECIVAKRPENISKNCFQDIFSYDENRVVLHAMDGLEPQAHGSDYINASYIRGLKKERHYVAAQGPTKWTDADFWRMVWQEGCSIVVMLNHVTDTHSECLMPDDITVTNVSNLCIHCLGRQHFADFICNEFELSLCGEKRLVRHLQFTRWPERGVPLSAVDLVEFHQKYRAIQTKYNATGPVIVHCQSGVGSTGVFIALDIAVEDIMETGECDVFETVQVLREQRIQMVQSVSQYQFLYEAVAHEVAVGSALISKTELKKIFDSLQIVPSSEINQLQQSFEDCNVTVLLARSAASSRTTQHHYDNVHIYDSPELKSELTAEIGYHNKDIYIDSYFRQDAIVATQMPSPDTIADFCLLVIKKRCSTIVMLNAVNEKDTNVLQYWTGHKFYGNVKVSSEVVLESQNYVLRNVSFEELTKHKGDRPSTSHSVQFIQYTTWDFQKSVVPEVDPFLKLIELVRCHMIQTHDVHLLVHCMNGSDQCALFCAIHNLIEKVEHEGFVNVASTVCKVKARLPAGLKTIEQYKFCYMAVNAYLSQGVLATKELTPKKDLITSAASGDRVCVGDLPTPTLGRLGCRSDKDAEESTKSLYELV